MRYIRALLSLVELRHYCTLIGGELQSNEIFSDIVMLCQHSYAIKISTNESGPLSLYQWTLRVLMGMTTPTVISMIAKTTITKLNLCRNNKNLNLILKLNFNPTCFRHFLDVRISIISKILAKIINPAETFFIMTCQLQ